MQDTDLMLFGIVPVVLAVGRVVNDENAVGTSVAITQVLLDQFADMFGEPLEVLAVQLEFHDVLFAAIGKNLEDGPTVGLT